MNSTIFINDLTLIDFSIINPQGLIVGASARLNLELTGAVDGHEGVVIDFSAAKKQIKELIDGSEGFDHKCWVNLSDPNIIVTDDLGTGKVTVTHAISKFSVSARADAFAWIDDFEGTQSITKFLNEKLRPVVVSKVSLNTAVVPAPFCNTETHVFRYVHGLKNSSSYGCKNIVHGHKSYLQATAHDPDSLMVQYKLKEIAQWLDGAIFAQEEDLGPSDGIVYQIKYSTDERGPMAMKFTQKLIVLETQTTVEHLVEYVAARFHDDLVQAGITSIYMSEGLCKGAKVTL